MAFAGPTRDDASFAGDFAGKARHSGRRDGCNESGLLVEGDMWADFKYKMVDEGMYSCMS